ncbi:peptidoglycan-binding protein [Inquilinus sp. NPDC058860]|uniref:peptidoglycan-binding protein n=1 Tax=Inquilinus sp. NPDC058860 TaxID=3346652 RepID=UPI0036AC4045
MAVTLNLIAIPNGLASDGRLALSIVVAPRLAGATALGAYPDMLDWTARIAAAPPRITLQFGAASVGAEPVPAEWRPDIWRVLFRQDTPVDPFEFDDARDRLVQSYRTRDALAILQERYLAMLERSPGSLPGAREARNLLDGFHLSDRPTAETLRELREGRYRRQKHRAAGELEGTNPLEDFFLFHRMPQPGLDAPDPIPRTAEALSRVFDFHKALTAIANHPALSRALGLVLDVTVPADAVARGRLARPGRFAAQAPTVAVKRFEPAEAFRDVVPMTPAVCYSHQPAADGQPAVFAAAAPGEDRTIVEGFLGLPETGFHLLDLDLDGALAKAMGLATMLQHAAGAPTVDGALPSLRSAGLSLAMHDRGAEVVQALARSAGIDAALAVGPGRRRPVVLGAADLVRGWRLDIWSASNGRWASLHRRRGTYSFGEDAAVRFEAEEEGFSQFAAASPVPDPTRAETPGLPPVETDLYVHEAMARWTGWSLSAPRPEQPIHRTDAHDPLKPDDSADLPVTAFPMRQSFTPTPRSLPRLRFGDRYRMRARVVDLAGNSPPPTEAEAGPASLPGFPVALPPLPDARPYLRHEPVPHPILVLRQVPEERRPALDRMVIRSFNADPSLDGAASPDVEERHVAPPRTSVDMAERHGMLDDAAGRVRGDPATLAMLVARDDAKLGTIAIGDPPTAVPVEDGPQLAVDYLPDPLARAAAFRFLPGVPPGRVLFAGAGGLVSRGDDPAGEDGPVLQVGFGPAWPDRRAFRIVAVDGDAPPAWDPVSRVLTVSLPKASVCETRLSSALADADLGLMAIWAWERSYLDRRAREIVAKGRGDDGNGTLLAVDLQAHARLAAQWSRLALEGGQWALTPSIPLHLIHAVQQPIGRPAFLCPPPAAFVRQPSIFAGRRRPATVPLVAMRAPGSPDATLVGDLRVHLASTGQIDLRARWDDVVLDPEDEKGFRLEPAQAMVEPVRLDRPDGPVPAQGAAGDDTLSEAERESRRRRVAVIRPPDRVSFAPERPRGPDDPAIAPDTIPAAAPIQGFGDTRHRLVRYEAVATSRFVGDFPADRDLDFTRTGDPVTVSVPGSARPPAPKIVQVLPTFGWQRERTSTLVSSVREGRGLRIYLDQPWYASGEGELLGVVLLPAGHPAPDALERRDRYAGRITEWGLDPLRRSGWLPALPSLADLTAATVTMGEVPLPLPERDTVVDVAGHAVAWDAGRKLWYADVTLRADYAYMPFVRLALVRFQPDSIPGAEISAVAPAQVIQIAPDRSAVLIADPDLPALYRLVVSGPGPQAGVEVPWRNRIEVTVEERRADVAGDLGWRPAPPTIVKVTAEASGADGPSALFSGLVEFAAVPAPGRYRLVIREYETWQVDAPEPGLPGLLTPRPGALLEARPSFAGPAAPAGGLAALRPAAPARRPLWETGFPATGRALERPSWWMLLPPTAARLVYAEFIGVEPPAIATDLSVGPDIGIGGPGPGQEPEEPPAWPSYAGPLVGFGPAWEEVPEIGPGAVSGTVKLAQAMLNAATALPLPLAIDGDFGAATEGAVRAFRAAALLPEAGGLDPRAWIALALAAPFPVLEPGLGDPPMAGPPVALLQRLLNIVADAGPLAETGDYSPDTGAAVAAFQADRGLPATGIVDPATWLAIGGLFDLVGPSGVERVVLDFDRGRLAAGEPAVQLVQRETIDQDLQPASDPLDQDWAGRSGTWLELRDGTGRPLFRRLLGQSLAWGAEVPGGDGEPMARPGPPPDRATITAVLPILPAARSLVVQATLEPHAPAVPVAVFEPW